MNKTREAIRFCAVLIILALTGVLLCMYSGSGPTVPVPTVPEQTAPAPRPMVTRSATLAFLGDFRPDCDTGKFNPQAIHMTLSALATHDPDLIVMSGDYLCAWPDESSKARDQLSQFKGMVKRALGPVLSKRTHYAYGNHEMGHDALVRVYLGDVANDVYTVPGAARVITFKSDFDTKVNDPDLAWLRATVSEDAPLTVFVRHEPWKGHGTRMSSHVRDVLKAGAVDLFVFGHEHRYERTGREIIAGNGGAGLEPGAWYGYVIVRVKPGGFVDVTAHDARTGTVRDMFSFKIGDRS